MATAFEFDEIERLADEPTFMVDVDGFEGPLDLLLALARKQKVDLARVSILALADQYLVFIDAARKLRLELAADYLVMAAWLAYLKSRLLLPKPASGDEPTGEELAEDLTARLQRLEAIRTAAAALMARQQLGRDIFARGNPEAMSVVRKPLWQATMFDLLSAYAQQRQKAIGSSYAMEKRTVWSLSDAREALERLLGKALDWTPVDEFLLHYISSPKDRRSARASSFAACLEMVREGQAEIRQDMAFSPLYMRKRAEIQVTGV